MFADVGCPFTHAGLRSFVARRTDAGVDEPRLRVRAWSLELVNGTPITGSFLAPEIAAIQAGPAPELFAGFDADAFPATTLPALASAAAAYRNGLEVGEGFSLAVRDALWEQGRDIADPAVLAELRQAHGVSDPTAEDEATIEADLAEGRARGVTGSPHFFIGDDDFFCPALDISHDDTGAMQVRFDLDGFERFIDAALR